MSTHIAVRYNSTPQGPADASAKGAATGSAAPDKSAPAGPLGFLAALLDQINATSAADNATGSDATAPDTRNGLMAALAALAASQQAGATGETDESDATTPTDPAQMPAAAPLFAHLATALRAVADALNAGEEPSEKDLKRLSDAVDALAALLPGQNAQTANPAAPDTALDPLAAIAAAGDAAAGTPADSADAAARPALPGLADLSQSLDDFATALDEQSPDLSARLRNLALSLGAAEADPAALAALTNPADDDGTGLDKIVSALMKNVPAAPTADAGATTATATTQPAIAAPGKLGMPASLVAGKDASSGSADDSTGKADAANGSTAAGDADSRSSASAGDRRIEPVQKDKDSPALHTAAHKGDDATKTSTADAGANGTATVQTAGTTPAAKTLPAAYQSATATPNMGQIAFEIAHQMHKGQSRFTIRLDPPELGRVDVKMHVDASGTINAHLTVEKAETLDMFQRDRSTLERALSQAGLDSGKTNLEFSLRQNPFSGMLANDQQFAGQRQSPAQPGYAASSDTDEATATPTVSLYRGTASPGGVNLFV